MSKEKKKFDLIAFILDIVIIVMLFVMFYTVSEFWTYRNYAKESATFSQDATRMAYDVEKNDYASLIQGKYVNEITGDNSAKTYNALANYVEALSMYKVYEKKGYTDKAQVQKRIMSTSRKEMKELKIVADKVDKMFGMNAFQ